MTALMNSSGSGTGSNNDAYIPQHDQAELQRVPGLGDTINMEADDLEMLADMFPGVSIEREVK